MDPDQEAGGSPDRALGFFVCVREGEGERARSGRKWYEIRNILEIRSLFVWRPD